MKRQKKYSSSALFSTPSLISGAGSVMNLGGNYYEFNLSEDEANADFLAIQNDFRMIGQDIHSSMEVMMLNEEGVPYSK